MVRSREADAVRDAKLIDEVQALRFVEHAMHIGGGRHRSPDTGTAPSPLEPS